MIIKILIAFFLTQSAFAWDKFKECDDEKIFLEQNQNSEFRLTMTGEAVDYLVLKGALPSTLVNSDHQFIAGLTKYYGHFRATINTESGALIFFDLYDYGHITLIATKDPHTEEHPGVEIAAWTYRYCRPLPINQVSQ